LENKLQRNKSEAKDIGTATKENYSTNEGTLQFSLFAAKVDGIRKDLLFKLFNLI